MPLKKKNLERLEVAFEVKQILDDDDDFFRFEGLASAFGNVDLVDDMVLRGAFIESLTKRVPIILWQHFSDEPIGMPEVVQEREDGLFIRVRLPKEDTLVSGRVIPQIKVGSIRTMSIGYKVIDFRINNEGIRELIKLELIEVSLVTFPANPMAQVTGFKTVTPFLDLPVADADREWNSSEAVARVRAFLDSTEKPSEEYRRAFLWYDETDADNFGAYKFPYADVINGTLTAIPRAINNASARLSQTDIFEADKNRVQRNIERYQEKFQSNDKQSEEFTITKEHLSFLDNIEEVTARTVEKALRDSGLFTKNAAVKLVSILNRSDSEEDEEDATLIVLKSLNKKANETEAQLTFKSMLNKFGE